MTSDLSNARRWYRGRGWANQSCRKVPSTITITTCMSIDCRNRSQGNSEGTKTSVQNRPGGEVSFKGAGGGSRISIRLQKKTRYAGSILSSSFGGGVGLNVRGVQRTLC